MVQNIDFLPASYKQKKQHRQTKVWRRSILVVFLLLVMLGTYQQHRNLSQLETRRDELQKKARQMLSQLGNADELKKKIDRLDTRADLRAVLQLQAKPTRVLATVTNSLPNFVSLTNFRMAHERVETKRKKLKKTIPSSSKEEEKAGSKLPEQTDLEQLRQAEKEQALFIWIEGIAPDDLAVSEYLAALDDSELFAEVQLMYSDQYRYRDYLMRNFRMRLRLRRPGETSSGKENQPQQQLTMPGARGGTVSAFVSCWLKGSWFQFPQAAQAGEIYILSKEARI